MHYFILGAGILIGLYALYRFFLRASVREIKAFCMMAVTVAICIALFYMAVTGRLPAALALVAAIAPFALGYAQQRARKQTQGNTADENSASDRQTTMTTREAYEILGLDSSATQDDIKNAYKKLMKKVHPDQEGSAWMAGKLNQAKELLLKKH